MSEFCQRHTLVKRILNGCHQCGAPTCCPACCDEATEGLEEHRREVALIAERDALRAEVATLRAREPSGVQSSILKRWRRELSVLLHEEMSNRSDEWVATDCARALEHVLARLDDEIAGSEAREERS